MLRLSCSSQTTEFEICPANSKLSGKRTVLDRKEILCNFVNWRGASTTDPD